MAKKIIFTFSIIIASAVLLFLLFFKFGKTINDETEIISKTVIPVSPSNFSGDTENKTNSNLLGIKTSISLNKDEVFIEIITADLNADGFEDQIVAIKKLLDPFIYLIPAIQNPLTKEFARIAEIRTSVTQPKSLSFYTIELQNSLPALVYSGMSSDKSQILVIYFIKADKQNILSFNMAADLRADVQIEMIDGRKTIKGTLDDYTIYTYNFDASAPETLNQIKTQYKWNNSANHYVKVNEIKIPGEKIESSFLKKLSNGSAETFREFLSGLWYQPLSSGSPRSLYFDNANNIFIFHIDNIQEIYTVTSVFPRRYGVSLMSNNKSISSIKRRIEIELKGIDEIRLKVVEDVARLKIGTASNWDGMYRKKTDNFNSVNTRTDNSGSRLKNIFGKNSEWINGSEFFKTEKFSYTLKNGEKEDSGFFDFIKIENQTIIQLRSSYGQNSFYTVTSEKDKKNGKTILKMIPVNIGFSGLSAAEEKAFFFEKKEEN